MTDRDWQDHWGHKPVSLGEFLLGIFAVSITVILVCLVTL